MLKLRMLKIRLLLGALLSAVFSNALLLGVFGLVGFGIIFVMCVFLGIWVYLPWYKGLFLIGYMSLYLILLLMLIGLFSNLFCVGQLIEEHKSLEEQVKESKEWLECIEGHGNGYSWNGVPKELEKKFYKVYSKLK